ncbi:MAG: hypothetical protein KAG66_19180, partial [Methylococcales bacterium]|nr:hypothetical protein [Methylococcales bacterium]
QMDDTPYFDTNATTPIDSLVSGSTSYTDAGMIGDTNTNHYYVLQAEGCANALNLPSNRIGEFDFAIVPGG